QCDGCDDGGELHGDVPFLRSSVAARPQTCSAVLHDLRSVSIGPRHKSRPVHFAAWQALTQPALVLLSGGQDSTTCFAWVLERYARAETIGFDYGQRHAVDLDCRMQVLQGLRTQFPRWARRLGQ